MVGCNSILTCVRVVVSVVVVVVVVVAVVVIVDVVSVNGTEADRGECSSIKSGGIYSSEEEPELCDCL